MRRSESKEGGERDRCNKKGKEWEERREGDLEGLRHGSLGLDTLRVQILTDYISRARFLRDTRQEVGNHLLIAQRNTRHKDKLFVESVFGLLTVSNERSTVHRSAARPGTLSIPICATGGKREWVQRRLTMPMHGKRWLRLLFRPTGRMLARQKKL